MKMHFRSAILPQLIRRAIPMLALTGILCVGLNAVTGNASALYILSGAADSVIVLDGQEEEAELQDFSSQLVYLDHAQSNGHEVRLSEGQVVTIHCDGAVVSARTRIETVSALLSRLHIEPGPLDMILVDLSGENAVITVSPDITYYDQETETAEPRTVRLSSIYLPKGEEKVLQDGAAGTRTAVYEVVYSGGELVSRQMVEELSCTAVDQQIAVGTAVTSVSAGDRIASVTTSGDGGVLTFRSGSTMRFSAVKSMTATAYTAGHGGADHYTATGTSVRVGTVAVDKNVIPLGSRLYILTSDGRIVYGSAVAEDTGVRGNIVDLYYDTYQQCINFGRRACTVYVLS